jgi:hypothetical protein
MDTENTEFMASFDLSSFVSNDDGSNGQSQSVQDAQGQNLGHTQGRGHGHGQSADDNQDRQEELRQRQQDVQQELYRNGGSMKRNVMINGGGAGAGESSAGTSQQHMRLPQRSSGQGNIMQGLEDPSNALMAALANNPLGQSQLSLETLQAFLGMQTPNSSMLSASFGGVDGQSRSQQQQQLQLPSLQSSSALLNAGSSSAAPSAQALLEQQVRLAQLQQLQQLQNQIFQQQVRQFHLSTCVARPLPPTVRMHRILVMTSHTNTTVYTDRAH